MKSSGGGGRRGRSGGGGGGGGGGRSLSGSEVVSTEVAARTFMNTPTVENFERAVRSFSPLAGTQGQNMFRTQSARTQALLRTNVGFITSKLNMTNPTMRRQVEGVLGRTGSAGRVFREIAGL